MANPATPVIHFLVKPKTDTKPISNTKKYFFIILYLIFALDFGFVQLESPRARAVSKLITLARSSAVFISLAFVAFDRSYGGSNSMWYFVEPVVFYMFTLTLILSKNTYYDYENDLHSFDAEIQVDSSTYKCERKIIIWFLLSLAYRIAVYFGFCSIFVEYCHYPIEVTILYNLTLLGEDVTLIVYTFVFYSAYLRMKRFTTFVTNDGTDVVSCQYLYKSAVEIIDKVKRSFDVVLILTLVTNTVNVTVSIYTSFTAEIFTEGPVINMLMMYVLVVHELLTLFAPAFTAGLLAARVERLKLVLYDKLIKDKSHAKDLKRFVGYIDGRPLRFRVWRVVPLDWRLPVIVVNISVTYLIVMIQFTHKY